MEKLRHNQQDLQSKTTDRKWGTVHASSGYRSPAIMLLQKVFGRGWPWVREGGGPPHKPGCGPPQHPFQPVWFHKWPGVPGREEIGHRAWASASNLMSLPLAITCNKMVPTGDHSEQLHPVPKGGVILPQCITQNMGD